MYKNLVAVVAIISTLLFSQTTLADAWGCGEGMRQMVLSMDLNRAQKDKIKPILAQLKASIKETGMHMGDLDRQLNQQSVAVNMDQSVVDDLVEKKTKLIGDMIKAKIKAKNQVLAVLNPKQKINLMNKMQKLEEKIAKKFSSCHKND